MSEANPGIIGAPWAAIDDAGMVSVDAVADLFGMSSSSLLKRSASIPKRCTGPTGRPRRARRRGYGKRWK
jgi:hypothetical protein